MKKILVVDDSDLIRTQLSNIIKDCGFEVVTAENGQIGLETYQNRPDFDLVISDLTMPKLDGFGMIKGIRETEKGKDVPILVLTSGEDQSLIDQGVSLGVKGWVVKPVDESMLKVGIKQLLGEV